MRSESVKKAGEWTQFGLGLLLGVGLAFIIYAGLQPRLAKTVHAQQALKDKAQKKDSLVNAVTTATATAALKGLQKAARNPATPSRPDASPPAPKQPAASPIQLTTLTPTGLSNSASGRRPGLAMGFGLVAMATALAAGVAAWRQSRREPQPPGAITSPLLEALFTLPTHRHLLQQELGLSPRQIKRFSSKARVQHSQLRALLKPLDSSLPTVFSVDNQVKAFQMLLLLEANRRQPRSLPSDNAADFISQLQAAYHKHRALALARQEAFQHPVIAQAKSREASATVPNAEDEARFMQQLYEMNAGLLA
jgi:hypothetical protein